MTVPSEWYMELEEAVTEMGRRGVQQLTLGEWREALEQQIREKEQQKQQQRRGIGGGDADQPQRRSQSAPQHGEGDGELISSVPGIERAATTAAVGEQVEGNAVAGRQRRFQQQSQDEYLKGLQEQIEEKKCLVQLEQEKKQSRRRRMSRSEDDADPGNRRDNCEDERKDCTWTDSPLRGGEKNEKPMPVSNQDEAEICEAQMPKGEVAADPVAITKIVDFCEELKRQNEDVKKQLLEQHAVLTSLHSTLAVEADAKAVIARRDGVRISQLKARPGEGQTTTYAKKSQAKDSKSKPVVVTPVILRPRPTRGETKIPLPRSRVGFSLRSAGADIVKASAQSNPELHRAEAKIGNLTCVDEIPVEIKVVPPDSPNKDVPKEEDAQLPETKACSLDSQDCTKSQEDKETAALKDQEKEEETDSSAKEASLECTSAFVSTDDRHVIQAGRGDDEKPMDTESKFVHDWESRAIGDDLLECTSITILNGPSSLVSLDQSWRDIFH